MEASVSKVESPPFSLARRRSSTINNRQHGGPEKEWTAARCNRLLRALTSRVAILKKDISRLQSADSKSDATESHARRRQKRVHASPGGADWAHPRKRVKNTYSARGGKANNRSRSAADGLPAAQKDGRGMPGDIAVPTPLAHRVMEEELPGNQPLTHLSLNKNHKSPEGKPRTRSKIRDCDDLFHLSSTMRELRKHISPSRYTTYEGIYYALEGLLKVTADFKQEQSQKGSTSLLSMCLRAVPHYIAGEEIALAAQLEETGSKSALYQRDVSTEIYDDLEAFGSSPSGWKHLRTVVRSHGTQVLCAAINERLIDTEFCGILISLCINLRAIREAETLLSSLLAVGPFARPKSVYTRFEDDATTRPFSIFWKFAARVGPSGYQYRQLSSTIKSGSLPISWLATKEFVSFWGRGVREFSSESVDSETITFFATVLPLLAGYGDAKQTKGRAAETTDAGLPEAVNHTFSTVVATLLAIVILNKEAVANAEGPLISSPDFKDILDLLWTCLTQWRLSNSINVKGTYFALAIIILQHYNGSSPDPELVDFLLSRIRRMNRSTQPSTPWNDFIVFLYSIARCCGRGASNSGFEYLQTMHGLLETLSGDREQSEKRIVREIIVDSAFAFARQASDRSHLEYAVSIEEKYHVMKFESADASPCEDGDERDGYRWEEGISEWVVATPTASSVASPREDFSSSDLESDAPFYRSSRPRYPASRSRFLNSFGSSPEEWRARVHGNTVRPSSPEYDSTESDSYEEDITTPSTVSRSRYVPLDDESDDELLMNPSPGYDLVTDELCMPDSPLSKSDAGNGRGSDLGYTDRAPRLKRKPPRHSLHWQLLDESDDELSCLSTISESNSPCQGSRRASGASSKSGPGRARNARISNLAVEMSFLSDSEDELGI